MVRKRTHDRLGGNLEDVHMRNKSKYNRSLVANLDIAKGEKVTEKMLGIKRPGNGLPPKELFKIIGLRAKVDISKDTTLRMSMFY